MRLIKFRSEIGCQNVRKPKPTLLAFSIFRLTIIYPVMSLAAGPAGDYDKSEKTVLFLVSSLGSVS
jgi:hypothetical protein